MLVAGLEVGHSRWFTSSSLLAIYRCFNFCRWILKLVVFGIEFGLTRMTSLTPTPCCSEMSRIIEDLNDKIVFGDTFLSDPRDNSAVRKTSSLTLKAPNSEAINSD